MKRLLLLVAVAVGVMACHEDEPRFENEVLLPFTPVKSQGGDATCWVYAMLSAIETEHICRGDSVHLSAAYVIDAVRHDPDAPHDLRGVGMTLVDMIGRHGLVPYEAMRDTLVPRPRRAFMYGVDYSVHEFARSVCAPGEWMALTCGGQSDAGRVAELDLADNWTHAQAVSTTADSLLAITERAVRGRHGVCWEGDTSEPGFDWRRGVARTSLLSGTTTDDHCMAIVGTARDGEGRPYFIMKNSWGKKNAYDGLMYLSYAYFLRKTVAVFMTREAAAGRAQPEV